MSLLLIMNPGSRSRRGQRLWHLWESGLQKAGVAFQCVRSEGIGHARELARTATCDVVAVGGDGTINEVLDGVLQSANPDLRMGVLYSGTSPDFCRFHGIPIAPVAALHALIAGKVRQVDVARISYHTAEGVAQLAHFGCSCNIGMGADIARYANRWRGTIGDVPGTAIAAIYTMLAHHTVDLEIEADGKQFTLVGVNNLTVAKNPFLASGLQLKLALAPDDGGLWLVAIHGQTRGGMLRVLPRCYSGTVTGISGVYVRRCTSVTICAAAVQEIEFDGDPHGFLPVRIEVIPRALALIGGTYA